MREAYNTVSRPRFESRRFLAKGLLLTLVVAVVLACDLWIVDSRERTRGDDFFQFWAAGRAILQGDDPYEPQRWRQTYEQEGRWRWQTDQPVFLYPLWTAFPFVPLAKLPVFWAALLWAVLSQLFLVLSAVLVIKGLKWNKYAEWLPLILAVFITFEPVSLTILFGQLGILLLVLMCGIFYLISHARYTIAGILLGLTLIKPQLFILVIPVLLLAMSLERRWPFIASFAISTTGLMISSWLLAPEWPARWQGHLAQTARMRLTIAPTIWGFSHTVVTALRRPDLWGIVSLAACLILMGIVSYLCYVRRSALRKGDQLAPLLSLTMIGSLLVTPYTLSYDFALLLLPVMTCLSLIQPFPDLMRRALLASLIGCAIFLPWALLAFSAQTGLETTAALLPASLLVILLIATFTDDRRTASVVLPKD